MITLGPAAQAALRNRARRRLTFTALRRAAGNSYVTMPVPAELWAVGKAGGSSAGAKVSVYAGWNGSSGTLVREITLPILLEKQRFSLGVINAGLTAVPPSEVRLAHADMQGTLTGITT